MGATVHYVHIQYVHYIAIVEDNILYIIAFLEYIFYEDSFVL